MLDTLFKFVFNLITKVADILISPLITGLLALFPSLSTYLSYITDYVNRFIDFIPLVRDICLIPRGAVKLLLDYYLIKYSIYLFKIAFNFVIKIYNLLKP